LGIDPQDAAVKAWVSAQPWTTLLLRDATRKPAEGAITLKN